MSEITDLTIRDGMALTGIQEGFSLELKILEAQIGKITTNAAEVLVAARKKCEEYADVEKFIGHEDIAKKEKAMLNNAVKLVDSETKRIKDAWMAPLNEFSTTMKEVQVTLKTASGDLDAVVKTADGIEKDKKRQEIEKYFVQKKFDLVPFDRIFNEKWLLKGSKMPAIREEIDGIISNIYTNIKILEAIAEHGPMAKAIYLDRLDMGEAMRQVEVLKQNAAKLAREKVERESREHREAVEANQAEQRQEAREAREAVKDEQVHDLAAMALDLPTPEVPVPQTPQMYEMALKFFGTEETLRKLRAFMSANDIAYQRAEIFATEKEADMFMRRENIAGVIYSLVLLEKTA